ncbi:hypothetical protein HQ576_15920, partial [bacterium]|nr:hypothetical protein [bacterium]
MACAVTLHRLLADASDGPPVPFAVDTGRLQQTESGLDGAALAQAPCLLAATQPGQILCSQRAATLAALELDPRLTLRDLGAHRPTAAAEPERLFAVEYAGMPHSKHPPTRGLVSRGGSIPSPLTRFIGRQDELSRIVDPLTSGPARLWTVLGPAGIGKTRLAIEAARRVADTTDTAVWFVPLADTVACEHIVAAMLRAVHPDAAPSGAQEDRLVEALSLPSALLVMDNLEHLLPEGAAIVQRLLERVPHLRCLVTSRHKLGVTGEHAFPLGPLPVPPEGLAPAELLECASVELFVERAQAVMPGFELTGANSSSVARLCTELEGIPLSLELAAAHTGVRTPGQMLAAADERLDWLMTHDPHRPARHRSVRAAIEASVSMLPPRLQAFFAQLSVFRGGWTLDAAEEVCRAPLATDHLAQLRDASLVVAESGGSELRFRLLDIVRTFAAERLPQDEAERLRERHAQYFRALADRARPELDGPGQAVWMDRLEGELGNLREALAWALGARPHWAVKMAADLGHFWEVRCHLLEGRDWLERALAGAPRAPLRVRTRAVLLTGWFAHILGEQERARERTRAGLDLS